MSRLFFNLIFILALSLSLAAQDSKPANASPAPAPAAQPAPAAGNAQSSPARPVAPAPGNATAAPAPPEAPAQPPLPPNTPVITLNFCPGAAPSSANAAANAPKTTCKKVITKAEFDRVLDAAIPRSRRPAGGDIPSQVKEAVAKEYVNMYIMSHEAEKRGLQNKDPLIEEMLQLSRMQVLAMALNQELQENTKLSDAEIEKYYNDNPSAFVEVSLRRLYIPKPAPVPNPTSTPANPMAANAATTAAANANDATPKPADADALKAAAEKLHDRAAAGEDLDKLEKEAFDAAGTKQTPPPTQMGNRRHGILPPDQDALVFALDAGGVSKLFDNPGGWYLYKVESKRTLPLNDVKEEIQRKLQPEKLKDARDAITGNIKSDLNEKYFGGASTSGPAPASGKAPSAPANNATDEPASAPKTSKARTGSNIVHKAQPAKTPAAANAAH